MRCKDTQQHMYITTTSAVCPIGEATGKTNMVESKIPVLSCEGACIRGEIARLAASIVSKKEPYFEFFRHLLKTDAYERYIETMKSELEKKA